MTETVKFVDGISYTEADQAEWNMRVERPQGIFADSTLGVIASAAPGGMIVRVTPGHAMIRGFLYANDANKDITITANASGSARIDTIVLRLVPTSNICTAQVLTGTPGAGAPALTQVVGGTWDFPICDVAVANGAASILTGNLTDRRVFSVWPASALDSAMATDTEVSAAVAAEAALRVAADNTEATTRAAADVKAWGIFSTASTGSILASKGISALTKLGTGDWRITLSPAMLTTNFCVSLTTNSVVVPSADITSTSTIECFFRTIGNVVADPAIFHIMVIN